MSFIKDNQGVEWELKLSLSAIRSICKKLGITMAQLTMLDLPISDILESVHYLCAKQLAKAGVSVDDFYDRIDDVPVEELLQTLQNCFYDAFPKMKKTEGEGSGPFVPGE